MKGSGAQTTHRPAEPGTYRMCSAAKTARHRIVVMLLTQVSQCGKRTVFLVWARVLRKSAGGYGEEEKKKQRQHLFPQTELDRGSDRYLHSTTPDGTVHDQSSPVRVQREHPFVRALPVV